MTTWNPERDGIDHINVYSKGRTELGRWLSNFAHTPIETKHGRFESIEGYWYWRGAEARHAPERDRLKALHGFDAKRVGRQLGIVDWPSGEYFKQDLLAALEVKARTNPEMMTALRESTQPLVHYYVFEGVVIEPKDGKWMLDFWQSKRGTP